MIYGPSRSPYILIGQAPTRGAWTPHHTLMNRRVRDLCGVDWTRYVRLFRRCNLLEYWPGPAGEKGDAWDADVARAQAAELEPHLDEQQVIMLGRNVARAFGIDTDFFEWRSVAFRRGGETLGYTYAVAPHPSGVSHWWNDPANRRDAEDFWRNTVVAV